MARRRLAGGAAAHAAAPPGDRNVARSTYRAFARAVRDFLRAAGTRNDAPSVSLDTATQRILDQAVRDAGPTLVLSGHFGPWELALQWLASRVGHLEALAAAHRSAAVEDFFSRRRAAAGIQTLSRNGAAASALARLRAGAWIAALADRGCGPRRHVAGLPGFVPIDRAPLLLARRARARILAGVSWRGEDGALHVRFLEPFSLDPARGGIPLSQAAARLQRFFDSHARTHPTQWYEWAGPSATEA